MLSFVLNNPSPIKQPTYANKRIVYLTHTETLKEKDRVNFSLCPGVGSGPSHDGQVCLLHFCQ